MKARSTFILHLSLAIVSSQAAVGKEDSMEGHLVYSRITLFDAVEQELPLESDEITIQFEKGVPLFFKLYR